MLIGFFVLLALATRQRKALNDTDLPLWAFVPVGFVNGVLNMIVGVIAPILGVLVIRKERPSADSPRTPDSAAKSLCF